RNGKPMLEVEIKVSTIALEHRFAVSSIREPDRSRGATEPIGKHTSQGDPSNAVAGPVQIRVETLGPVELIVREPMPEAVWGVGTHVQVDVPQVKRRIGRADAYGRREIRSPYVVECGRHWSTRCLESDPSSAAGHIDRWRAVGQLHRVGHRYEHFARS